MTVKGYKASFGDDENVLKLTVVMVAQHCECTKCHGIVHLKVFFVCLLLFWLCWMFSTWSLAFSTWDFSRCGPWGLL